MHTHSLHAPSPFQLPAPCSTPLVLGGPAPVCLPVSVCDTKPRSFSLCLSLRLSPCTKTNPQTDGQQPLGEGTDYNDEDGGAQQHNGLAEAWQNARAAGHTNSSWGGSTAAAGSGGGARGSSGSGGGDGSGPVSARPSARFQLSFSNDGSGQQQSASGGSVQLRKQDTWVSEAGAAAATSTAPDRPSTIKLQQRHAAATSFLSKHGFMVDDLVGDVHELAVQRSQWSILLLHVISILQRCLTAVMFGLFHASYISVTQLGVLISLHAGFVGYLLLVRPYASWLLLLSDVLAYLCELTVLASAVLLQRDPGYAQHQRLATALVTCYFFDVAAMVVPELMRYAAMAWAWLQARRARQFQQQQQQQQPEGDGQQEEGGVHGKGQRRRQPSSKSVNAAADGAVVVGRHSQAQQGGYPQGDAAAARFAAAAALKLSGSGGKA